MGAIGLNPIRLDAIGLDPIRFNAIRLGVPGTFSATDRPYISPDVLSALAGVWIADGKSNTDPDRNIIKNKLPGRGGDFELLNFAYKLNSGYGKYEEDFTAWGRDASELLDVRPDKVIISDVGGINSYRMIIWKGNTHTKAFKAKVTGIPHNGRLIYSYAQNEGDALTNISIDNDGVYEFPYSYGFTNGHGFLIDSGTELEDWIGCTIEFIPSLQGSLCTDGINDMIVSQNTVEEMGITDKFTVVSMIHQITLRGATAAALTNYIRQPIGYEYVRNHVANIGKTGIYGYAVYDVNHSNANNSHVINTILGDKNDYSIHIIGNLSQGKFSVQGYINSDNNIVELSQVAWYWTFIAKRALTTDEINQVIAYYNLDKYVKPDIYYNVKKQGVTNDNHAQFGDKLIDYSGNSRDLQLFNIGWNPGSGIGKYVTNFGIWSKDAESNISYNSYSFTVNGSLKRTWLMWYVTELPSFKIKVSGINSNGYVDYGYYDNGSLKNFRLDKDGIHTLPPSGASSNGHGFKVNDTSLDWTGLVIEQIPDFAGALCFDGVDDFGINKDVPTFTDFTVIAKRTWLEENTSDKPFIIKGDSLYPDGNQNAFLFEYGKLSTYSFGQNNKYDESVVPSLISYATTYSYNGVIPLVRGSATDTIGIDVAHSTKIALYFLMLFPYSMSEFLIERQLKKHKLGTLYPGMVEFRPIISGRTDLIKEIKWYSDSWSKRIYVGDYIPKGVDVTANILLNDNTSELVKATYGNNYTEVRKQANWSETNNEWDLIIHNIGKSPQKIGITIDEYIRFEDIVQPYPSLFTLIDYDTEEVYSWGSKLKVGARFKGDVVNLLPNMYEWQGDVLYNGEVLNWGINPGVVAKEMVFSWNMPFKYLIDNNEPKCILSPRLLRIPNSSYKILGYIPDISGHGNHGKINNSAYAGMSGANGYPYDYKNGFMAYSNCRLVDSEIFNVISISPTVNIIKNTPTYKGKIKVTGLSGYLNLRIYPKDDSTNAIEILEDGVYDINIDNETGSVYFHVVKTKEGSNDISVIIQQVGEYEGAFYLDGVDDFITIPTLSKGGKQVLMKVNWSTLNGFIYDQRPASGDKTFGIYTQGDVIAYSQHNNGNTYIDGIINNNIIGSNLSKITHNIVATCDVDNSITPSIGKRSYSNSYFAQMALYAFMLFDEISTDEGIKDLNDIVGIVSKVELPPYYWDTYGKTNTDADRDEIVNLASDEVSIQYPTDFTDTSVWEDMGAVTSSAILTLTTWAMGGDTGIGNTIKAKVATPAMKVKFITDGNGYLDYMYSGYNTLELPRDAGEYEVELPASTIVDGWGARFSGSGNGSFTIELLGNEVRLGTLKVINSAYDEDSGYGGTGLIVKFSKDYHDNGFWKFVENRSEFNVLNNGDSVNIINAKSVEALFYMAATTKKAFYKVTGVSTGKGIKFGTDNVSPWEGVIAEKDGIYEVDWSLNVHTGTGDLLAPCILSNGWLGDCNIVIEQVKQYPNGIALDGVDDSLVNTDIPAFTDFTVIAKRIFLGDQPNNVVFLFKGDKVYGQGVGNALLMEYRYDNGTYANYIFSNANSITLNEGDISYVTPTDYNGQQMNYVVNTDNKGLVIGRSNAVYWKGVFYKLMLYPKTIDILSINMLKNLFERDEIIDLNNPIFKK